MPNVSAFLWNSVCPQPEVEMLMDIFKGIEKRNGSLGMHMLVWVSMRVPCGGQRSTMCVSPQLRTVHLDYLRQSPS